MNITKWAKRGVSVTGLLAVWLVAATVGPEPFPGPIATTVAFVDQINDPNYWTAIVRSTLRVWGAFVLAVLLAVPLGLLIGWNRVFSDFTFPALEVQRPIPPIAWLSFSIVAIPTLYVTLPGMAERLAINSSVVFIAFLGAFFPLLLNVIDGVRGLDKEYSRAAESLGATKWQTFRHVIYSGALPSVHTGMVVGMGLAWVNLVAAEMIATGGLGYLTWSAFTAGNYPVIIVGMISIGTLGYLSSAVIRLLGDWKLVWAETARD